MPGAGSEIYSQCLPVYDTEYTNDCEQTPTTAVLDAVAWAADVDVMNLPPLYEAIDPDGLDRLFTDRVDEDTILGFAFDDFYVFVRGDGRIRVLDPTEQREPTPVFGGPRK